MLNQNANAISIQRQNNFANDPNNPHQLTLIAFEIKVRVNNIKQEMLAIGRLLTEAKQLQEHGKFQKWIENNFDFSYQTANNLMNVYVCCIDVPNVVTKIKASVLYNITSPKFPAELREYIFENIENIQDIDSVTIQEIYRRFKAGEIDLESSEVKALVKYDSEKAEYSRYCQEVQSQVDLLKKLQSTAESVCSRVKWPVQRNKYKTELTKRKSEEIEDILLDIEELLKKIAPTILLWMIWSQYSHCQKKISK